MLQGMNHVTALLKLLAFRIFMGMKAVRGMVAAVIPNHDMDQATTTEWWLGTTTATFHGYGLSRRGIIYLSLLLSLSAFQLNAQSLPKPLSLGSAASAEIRYVDTVSDGMQIIYYQLVSPLVRLNWYTDASEWRVSNEPDPSVSISFSDWRMPSKTLSISFHKPNPDFSDYSSEAMGAYRASIDQKWKRVGAVKHLNAGDAAPPPGSPPFISGNYRLVKYRVEPEDPKRESFAAMDCIQILDGGHIIIIRYQMPADQMSQFESGVFQRLALFGLP